jgi:hypothetical protein
VQDGDVEHVLYKVIVGDVIVSTGQLFYVEVQPVGINLLLLVG